MTLRSTFEIFGELEAMCLPKMTFRVWRENGHLIIWFIFPYVNYPDLKVQPFEVRIDGDDLDSPIDEGMILTRKALSDYLLEHGITAET